MDKVVVELTALGREIMSTINNMNYGGCGIFAGHAANELATVPTIKNARVRIGSPFLGDQKCRPDLNSIVSNTPKSSPIGEALEKNGVRNYHLVVEFTYKNRVWFFDSEGLYEGYRELKQRANLELYNGWLSGDLTLAYTKERDRWNSTFARNQVPAVKRIIKKHVSVIRNALRDAVDLPSKMNLPSRQRG